MQSSYGNYHPKEESRLVSTCLSQNSTRPGSKHTAVVQAAVAQLAQYFFMVLKQQRK